MGQVGGVDNVATCDVDEERRGLMSASMEIIECRVRRRWGVVPK